MRKKSKKGFTLTEVLLAMAVIGVISALAIPQLVKSVQKDKAGVTLGKAVEQIELGCQNMMQDYNSRDDAGASMVDMLSAMDGDFAFSFDRLAPYIGATRITQEAQGGFIQLGRPIQYRFNKFPAEIQRSGFLQAWIVGHIFTHDDIMQDDIIIDVNGLQNPPNQPGVDRFQFDLRNDGKLIPEGLDSHTCDGDNPAVINANCTARVVRDGFKIKYNW